MKGADYLPPAHETHPLKVVAIPGSLRWRYESPRAILMPKAELHGRRQTRCLDGGGEDAADACHIVGVHDAPVPPAPPPPPKPPFPPSLLKPPVPPATTKAATAPMTPTSPAASPSTAIVAVAAIPTTAEDSRIRTPAAAARTFSGLAVIARASPVAATIQPASAAGIVTDVAAREYRPALAPAALAVLGPSAAVWRRLAVRPMPRSQPLVAWQVNDLSGDLCSP